MQGDPRLVVPEVQSAREVLALKRIMPRRCRGLLPASGILTERTGVPGTSPFRKPSLSRDFASGPEFGNDPECGLDWGSGELGTDPVGISRTRWSSSLAERSGSSPAPFRCFRVWTPPLAPQPLADCAQPPLHLSPRKGSQSEIRVGPGTILASGFRRAESASRCPQRARSSVVCNSRGWGGSSVLGMDPMT